MQVYESLPQGAKVVECGVVGTATHRAGHPAAVTLTPNPRVERAACAEANFDIWPFPRVCFRCTRHLESTTTCGGKFARA